MSRVFLFVLSWIATKGKCSFFVLIHVGARDTYRRTSPSLELASPSLGCKAFLFCIQTLSHLFYRWLLLKVLHTFISWKRKLHFLKVHFWKRGSAFPGREIAFPGGAYTWVGEVPGTYKPHSQLWLVHSSFMASGSQLSWNHTEMIGGGCFLPFSWKRTPALDSELRMNDLALGSYLWVYIRLPSTWDLWKVLRHHPF